MSHSAFDEGQRRRFVADPDVLAALDMTITDLADPDVRSIVIRHEHPEFENALNDERSTSATARSTRACT